MLGQVSPQPHSGQACHFSSPGWPHPGQWRPMAAPVDNFPTAFSVCGGGRVGHVLVIVVWILILECSGLLRFFTDIGKDLALSSLETFSSKTLGSFWSLFWLFLSCSLEGVVVCPWYCRFCRFCWSERLPVMGVFLRGVGASFGHVRSYLEYRFYLWIKTSVNLFDMESVATVIT